MTLDGRDTGNTDHAVVQSNCAFFSYNFHLCSLLMLYLSEQLTAKTQTSRSVSHVTAVKTEPVDMDEGIQNHLSSLIFILSSEGEDATPKAKPAKTKDFPSSLKDLDILNRALKKKSQSVNLKPMPRRKGKEVAADAEEPVIDLPNKNQPLSEDTVKWMH